MVGNIEEKVEEFLNGVFLSFNETTTVQKSRKLITKEYLTNRQEKNQKKLGQIEITVSGKWKTCLKDIWKVFYKDNQQKTGYFLVNDYHREWDFNNLNIGRALNICLVQGYKHQFLSRILL